MPERDAPDEVLAYIRRVDAEAELAAERERQAEAAQDTLW